MSVTETGETLNENLVQLAICHTYQAMVQDIQQVDPLATFLYQRYTLNHQEFEVL